MQLSVIRRILVCLFLSFMWQGAVAQLTCDFNAITSTVGCPPLAVQFQATVSGGSNYTYNWDLGNSTTVTPATNNAPSTTYLGPGTYTVRLTVYSGSNSATVTKTAYITVRDTPIVNFATSSPRLGCPLLGVQFSNSTIAGGTGSNTYNWYFGDGSAVDHSFAPSHNYDNITSTTKCNTVTLNVVNSYGCQGSKSIQNYICVYPKPTANFSGSPTSFCTSAGGTTTFTATANGNTPLSYAWDFGDPPVTSTGSGNPVNHAYSGPKGSNFTVKLDVTDANGCKTTVTKSNYINIVNFTANFTAPASACIYTPVTFTNASSTSLGGAQWSFGDPLNGTSTSLSPTYTFTTAGTYNVRMIGFVNGCPDTAIKQIVIYPQPNVNFTINPPYPCPPPTAVTFIPSTTTNITNFEWDFGVVPQATSTSSSPVYTYQTPCFYTPTLTVTDNHGCKDTIQKFEYVKLYDLVVKATANGHRIDSGCMRPIYFRVADSTHCPGPGLSPYPYGIASVLWDFGNSNYSTQINPIYTYPDTGIYRVIVTVTTVNGCVGKDTIEVRVGQMCKPGFYTLNTRTCNRKQVCFIDTTMCPVTRYEWHFITFDNSGRVKSDAELDNVINPCWTFVVPDTYSVKLITYHHGCKDSLFLIDYIIVDSPGSVFDIKYPDCDTPTKVSFKNLAIGATSWIWYFGDNTTSTDTSPVHYYPALGTYTARLVTFNSRSGCSDTLDQMVRLVSGTPSFTANDTAICKGDTVYFTGALANATPTAYRWFVDNVFMTTLPYNTYWQVFNASGFHTVRLVTFDDHSCPDTITKTNYIFVSKPVVADTAIPLSGCVPLTVNFTDNTTVPTGATITSRIWYLGTGSPFSTTGNTTSYTYNAAGDYDHKLIVTDNVGCKDSIVKPQYIHAYKPDANFYVKDTACVKEDIIFYNTSLPTGGIDSSYWDFGDSWTSNVFQPTHKYLNTGTYPISLIVKDTHGCRDTMVVPNKVTIVKPTANFTMSDSITSCAPLSVVFTNTSVGAVSYLWIMGSGNQSSLKNATEVYLYPGVYTIKLIATNSFGCTDTMTKQVKILGYAGAFTYTPLIGCSPLTVQFTPSVSGVSSITYDFNDGNILTTSTFGTVSHTYATPGKYVPKLIITDRNGCKNSSQGVDTIKVDAVVPGFKTGPACEYSLVDFTDTSWGYFSNPAAWYWVFHDGSITNKQNPKFNYGAPGKYPVKLVVTTTRGCKDSIIKDVDIHALPAIDAGPDTTICLKDSAILMPAGGVSYEWAPANYLSCTSCANPLAGPPFKMKYVVTGTDANGCKNNDTVVINIKTKVEAQVGPGGEICDDEKIQLDAKGGRSYVWSPPDGLSDANIANPIASPDNTIKYKVVAYEASCIPDTNYVDVIVHPLPTVKATGSQTIIAGNSAVIQASGSLIHKFMWSPSESLSCSNCADPLAKPTKTTTYTITVFTEYGCQDSDKVTIQVICDESQVFIPNTFTPNGDGQNDVFYPRGNGISKVTSFRIYDRWGEIVYRRDGVTMNDANVGWDGTKNGTVLPPDVFVYILEAQCDSGEPMTIKGDITLIR